MNNYNNTNQAIEEFLNLFILKMKSHSNVIFIFINVLSKPLKRTDEKLSLIKGVMPKH